MPGFERFLLHKEFSQLRAAAHSGPVVILNAAESRCDALVVRADVDHVIHVPLPNFTFQRSAGFQNMLKSLLGHARVVHCDDLEREGSSVTRAGFSWESLLSTWWKSVVKPILDALDLSVRDVMSVEFTADLSLPTDSWEPVTHLLVSNWPFRISSYPCSRVSMAPNIRNLGTRHPISSFRHTSLLHSCAIVPSRRGS